MITALLETLATLARRAQAARAAERLAWLRQFRERLRGVPRQ